MTSRAAETEAGSLEDLYGRPGFLLRRAHQISVSIFLASARDIGITTTQYGVLVILQRRENLDQIRLSKLVGLDRSTTALVLGKLEADGLVVRKDDAADRRRKALVLTAKGARVIARLQEPAERARRDALSIFTPEESETFLHLLKRFVDHFNGMARAPIEDENISSGRLTALPVAHVPQSRSKKSKPDLLKSK